jgi:ribosome-associated protein
MSSAIRNISVAGLPVQERFVRSIGSRGQNADHDGTAVELRVPLDACPLPLEVKSRLRAQNRNHITKAGTFIVVARSSRSQLENRRAARAQLLAALDRAYTPALLRAELRPPQLEREDRLRAKHRRADAKLARSNRVTPDESA